MKKEKELVEAQRRADIERKRRRRATALSIVSGFALVLALGAMFWAFKKQDEAEKALNNYRIAEGQRKQLEARQLIERAKTLRDAGYLKKANIDLDDAIKLDTTQQTSKEVEDLRKTIQ